jgi:glycosyltransferase involved in cell wall biosynthesis
MHDLVWKEYGDTMRFPGRQVEDFMTPRALARADVIAVVSEFTRAQLHKYFPQWAHKVTLVPGASMLAGQSSERAPRDAADSGYFLFVGTLEPRKNLPRLLRAYRRYVQDNPRARPLKIAGGSGWGKQDIPALLLELGLEAQVELLGRVGDNKLAALYRGAYALLMPSLYEGFGLPVVEALSMGVPVITSRESAMSEVAGSAGLYVDPASERDITQAITRISEDAELYSRLVRCIPLEIVRYEWDDSARKMAELLLLS